MQAMYSHFYFFLQISSRTMPDTGKEQPFDYFKLYDDWSHPLSASKPHIQFSAPIFYAIYCFCHKWCSASNRCTCYMFSDKVPPLLVFTVQKGFTFGNLLPRNKYIVVMLLLPLGYGEISLLSIKAFGVSYGLEYEFWLFQSLGRNSLELLQNAQKSFYEMCAVTKFLEILIRMRIMRKNSVAKCALSKNAQKFCNEMCIVTKYAVIMLQDTHIVT